MKESVLENPVIPVKWGAEKKGMATGEEISDLSVREFASSDWNTAKENSIYCASLLHSRGIHKSICNRLIEPFMHITVLISSTEWENFFDLRCSSHAEVHMELLANAIRDAIKNSSPLMLNQGEWHLPYIEKEDLNWVGTKTDPITSAKLISVARCARLSYTLFGSNKKDLEADLKSGNDRIRDKHWSPFEHQARVELVTDNLPLGALQARIDFPKRIKEEIKWMDTKLITRVPGGIIGCHHKGGPHLEFSNSELASSSGNFFGWSQFRKEVE